MSSLEEIRTQIDGIDGQIVELIARRADLAQEAKQHKTGAVLAPEREEKVLRRAEQLSGDRLPHAAVRKIMQEIISICRARQTRLRVAYLGPEGTFSQRAVEAYFGSVVEGVPIASIEEVLDVADADTETYAVVPVESSLAGPVAKTIEGMAGRALRVIAEVELQIAQCLLGREADLAKIERIYSHEKSFKQCAQWLEKRMPHAAKIQVNSNAEAMRRAGAEADSAAIGGEHGAPIYDLRVLEKNIHDTAENVTRFWIVGHQTAVPTGSDKTSLVLVMELERVTAAVAHAKELVRKLEALPAVDGQEKKIWLDLEGHETSEPIKQIIAALRKNTGMVQVLGSYPKTRPV